MSPQQIDSFLALGLGFAVAGFVAAIYNALRHRPVSFRLLLGGGPATVAAIPIIAFAGPAIIMRNTIRGRKYERRKVHFVAIATIIASFWAIAIGFQLMKLVAGFLP
jgi:O-antigen/teichoic acid export membrane protein